MRLLTLPLLWQLLTVPTTAFTQPPSDPAEVRPLPVGRVAPAVDLQAVDGSTRSLASVLDGKPALVVFYRGGWCPFCTLQLSSLRTLQPELDRQGVQLIAVSPDDPAHLRKTLAGQALDYTLLSDATASALQAFGVAFEVDAVTRAKYAAFGIDLEAASGHAHHLLPVPSVFVVDAAGVIQFNYSHPDYRTRVPVRVIRAAVEAVVSGEAGRALQR